MLAYLQSPAQVMLNVTLSNNFFLEHYERPDGSNGLLFNWYPKTSLKKKQISAEQGQVWNLIVSHNFIERFSHETQL